MNMPTSDREKALWAKVLEGEKPRYAGFDLGIPPNQIAYYCTKWTQKKIYDYGTSLDLGWASGNYLGDLAPNAIIKTRSKERDV